MRAYAMWTWATLAMVVALCVFEMDQAPRDRVEVVSIVSQDTSGPVLVSGSDARNTRKLTQYLSLKYAAESQRANLKAWDADATTWSQP